MTNLTYTAQGSFNDKNELHLSICIPKEPATGTYRTELYNLSKNTENGPLNVVFCHFSDGTDNPMQHNSFDYNLHVNLNNLRSYDGALPFDESRPETMVIFYHNTAFTIEDRNLYFNTIVKIYDRVKRYGNQSEDGIAEAAKAINVPRKVGLSLVIKLGAK